MRIFRSHTEVPVVANPTLAGLAREWVAINTAAEYHRQVAKLHINGCLTPGAIVDAIDRSATDYAARDQLAMLVVASSSTVGPRSVEASWRRRSLVRRHGRRYGAFVA